MGSEAILRRVIVFGNSGTVGGQNYDDNSRAGMASTPGNGPLSLQSWGEQATMGDVAGTLFQ